MPGDKPTVRSLSHQPIVCAGLAEWLGWDIALVRLLYLLVSIISAAFPGVLAYVILWIVMPEENSP